MARNSPGFLLFLVGIPGIPVFLVRLLGFLQEYVGQGKVLLNTKMDHLASTLSQNLVCLNQNNQKFHATHLAQNQSDLAAIFTPNQAISIREHRIIAREVRNITVEPENVAPTAIY